MLEFNNKKYNCPLEMVVDLLGGKWKVLILWNLADKTMRFNELRRTFTGLSHKMLAQQLRELENDNIIGRTVYPQSPPKVEYYLTEFGRSLIPILRTMNQWGDQYIKQDPKSP